MKKSANRLMAAAAVLLMGALGFGGCFNHHGGGDDCPSTPSLTAGCGPSVPI